MLPTFSRARGARLAGAAVALAAAGAAGAAIVDFTFTLPNQNNEPWIGLRVDIVRPTVPPITDAAFQATRFVETENAQSSYSVPSAPGARFDILDEPTNQNLLITFTPDSRSPITSDVTFTVSVDVPAGAPVRFERTPILVPTPAAAAGLAALGLAGMARRRRAA